MRIHTKLTEAEFRACLAPGTQFHNLTEHGSRIAARAFNVTLEGSGGRNNTGMYGAGDYDGATWDEWGAFFGRLYLADPAAVCGGTAAQPIYRDAEHFNWTTCGRFASGEMPADTHPRHRWSFAFVVGGSYRVSNCQKCDAITRSVAYGHTWEEIAS